MANYKICLVGDAMSGKTVAIKKRLSDRFERNYLPTVGADVFRIGAAGHKLTVWDTAGTETHGYLHEGYYRGSDAVVVVSERPNWWIRRVRRSGMEAPFLVFRPKEIPDDVFEQAVERIESEQMIEIV
jgi:GTPase SAR1 family protein